MAQWRLVFQSEVKQVSRPQLSFQESYALRQEVLAAKWPVSWPRLGFLWRVCIVPLTAFLEALFGDGNELEELQHAKSLGEWQRHARLESKKDWEFFLDHTESHLSSEDLQLLREARRNGQLLLTKTPPWKEWCDAWKSGQAVTFLVGMGEEKSAPRLIHFFKEEERYGIRMEEYAQGKCRAASYAARLSNSDLDLGLQRLVEQLLAPSSTVVPLTEVQKTHKKVLSAGFRDLVVAERAGPFEVMRAAITSAWPQLEEQVTIPKEETPLELLRHWMAHGRTKEEKKAVKERFDGALLGMRQELLVAGAALSPQQRQSWESAIDRSMKSVEARFSKAEHFVSKSPAIASEGDAAAALTRPLLATRDRLIVSIGSDGAKQSESELTVGAEVSMRPTIAQGGVVHREVLRAFDAELVGATFQENDLAGTESHFVAALDLIDRTLDEGRYGEARKMAELLIARLPVPSCQAGGFWSYVGREDGARELQFKTINRWLQTLERVDRYQWEAMLHLGISHPEPHQILGFLKTRAILTALIQSKEQRLLEWDSSSSASDLRVLVRRLLAKTMTLEEAQVSFSRTYHPEFHQLLDLLKRHPYLRLPLAEQKSELELLQRFFETSSRGRVSVRCDSTIDPIYARPNGQQALSSFESDRRYLQGLTLLFKVSEGEIGADAAHRLIPLLLKLSEQRSQEEDVQIAPLRAEQEKMVKRVAFGSPGKPFECILLQRQVAMSQMLLWPDLSLQPSFEHGETALETGLAVKRAADFVEWLRQEASECGGSREEMLEYTPQLVRRKVRQQLPKMGRLNWIGGEYIVEGYGGASWTLLVRGQSGDRLMYLPFGIDSPVPIVKMVHSDQNYRDLVTEELAAELQHVLSNQDGRLFNPEQGSGNAEAKTLRDQSSKTEWSLLRRSLAEEERNLVESFALSTMESWGVEQAELVIPSSVVVRLFALLQAHFYLATKPLFGERIEMLLLRPSLLRHAIEENLPFFQQYSRDLLEKIEQMKERGQWRSLGMALHLAALLKQAGQLGALYPAIPELLKRPEILPHYFLDELSLKAPEAFTREEWQLLWQVKRLFEGPLPAGLLPLHVREGLSVIERRFLPFLLYRAEESFRQQILSDLAGVAPSEWRLQQGSGYRHGNLFIDLQSGALWKEGRLQESTPLPCALPATVKEHPLFRQRVHGAEQGVHYQHVSDPRQHEKTVHLYSFIAGGQFYRWREGVGAEPLALLRLLQLPGDGPETSERWVRFLPPTALQGEAAPGSWKRQIGEEGLWWDEEANRYFLILAGIGSWHTSQVFEVTCRRDRVTDLRAGELVVSALQEEIDQPFLAAHGFFLHREGKRQIEQIHCPRYQCTLFSDRVGEKLVWRLGENLLLLTPITKEWRTSQAAQTADALWRQLGASASRSLLRLVEPVISGEGEFLERAEGEERWLLFADQLLGDVAFSEVTLSLKIDPFGHLTTTQACSWLAIALLAKRRKNHTLLVEALQASEGLVVEPHEQALFERLSEELLREEPHSLQSAALWLKGALILRGISEQQLGCSAYQSTDPVSYFQEAQRWGRVYALYQKKGPATLLSGKEIAAIESVCRTGFIHAQEAYRRSFTPTPIEKVFSEGLIPIYAFEEIPESFFVSLLLAEKTPIEEAPPTLASLESGLDPLLLLQHFSSYWNDLANSQNYPMLQEYRRLFLPLREVSTEGRTAQERQELMQGAEVARRLLLTLVVHRPRMQPINKGRLRELFNALPASVPRTAFGKVFRAVIASFRHPELWKDSAVPSHASRINQYTSWQAGVPMLFLFENCLQNPLRASIDALPKGTYARLFPDGGYTKTEVEGLRAREKELQKREIAGAVTLQAITDSKQSLGLTPMEEKAYRERLAEYPEVYPVDAFLRKLEETPLLSMRHEAEMAKRVALLEQEVRPQEGTRDFATEVDLTSVRGCLHEEIRLHERREIASVGQWDPSCLGIDEEQWLSVQARTKMERMTFTLPEGQTAESLGKKIEAARDQLSILLATLREGYSPKEFEALLDRYQSGMLTAEERSEVDKITQYLYAAIAKQQLCIALSECLALKRKTPESAAWQIGCKALGVALRQAQAFDRYEKQRAENPAAMRKYLVLEYRRRVVIRPQVCELIEKMVADPSQWRQLRQGMGKTSYAMGLIAALLIEKGQLVTLVVPRRQAARNRVDFELTSSLVGKHAAYRLALEVDDRLSSGELAEVMERLLRLHHEGHYPVTDIETLAQIKNGLSAWNDRLTKLLKEYCLGQAGGWAERKQRAVGEEIIDLSSRLYWLTRIDETLTKSYFLSDEVDSEQSILKEQNRVKGGVPLESPDNLLQEVVLDLFEKMWSCEGPLRDALLQGTQVHLAQKPEQLRGVLEEFLERVKGDFLTLKELSHWQELKPLLLNPEASLDSYRSYGNTSRDKQLAILKELLSITLPNIFAFPPNLSFGFSTHDGVHVIPKIRGAETENARFSDPLELVAYYALAFGQCALCRDELGKNTRFWEGVMEALPFRLPRLYQELKAAAIGRNCSLLELLLDPEKGKSYRFAILRSEVFDAGLVRSANQQYHRSVQQVIQTEKQGGITGSLSCYMLPRVGEQPSELIATPQLVEGETLFLIAQGHPQGFQTPCTLFTDEEAHLNALALDPQCVAILNGGGYGMQGRSILDFIAARRRANPDRDYCFLQRNERGDRLPYVWVKGGPIAVPLAEARPKNDPLWIYQPEDTIGVDQKIPQGIVHALPGPTDNLQGFCQMVWRARGLADIHTLQIDLSQTFADQVKPDSIPTFGEFFTFTAKSTEEQQKPLNCKAQRLRVTDLLTRKVQQHLNQSRRLPALHDRNLDNLSDLLGRLNQQAFLYEFFREPFFERTKQIDYQKAWEGRPREEAVALLVALYQNEQERAKNLQVDLPKRFITFCSERFSIALSQEILGSLIPLLGQAIEHPERSQGLFLFLRVLGPEQRDLWGLVERQLPWLQETDAMLKAAERHLEEEMNHFLEYTEMHEKKLPLRSAITATESGTQEQVQEQQVVTKPKGVQLVEALSPTSEVHQFRGWNAEDLRSRFRTVFPGVIETTGCPGLTLRFTPEMALLWKEYPKQGVIEGCYLLALRSQYILLSQSDYDFVVHSDVQLRGGVTLLKLTATGSISLRSNQSVPIGEIARAKWILRLTEFTENENAAMREWIWERSLQERLQLQEWVDRQGTPGQKLCLREWLPSQPRSSGSQGMVAR